MILLAGETYVSPPAALVRDEVVEVIPVVGRFDAVSAAFAEAVANAAGELVLTLTPAGKKGPLAETLLYTFCQKKDCGDGDQVDALTADASGNLFGTTTQGGSNGTGTVFQYSAGTLTTLHSFCSKANCTDGATGRRTNPGPQWQLVGDDFRRRRF